MTNSLDLFVVPTKADAKSVRLSDSLPEGLNKAVSPNRSRSSFPAVSTRNRFRQL